MILPVAMMLWFSGLLTTAVADAPDVVQAYPGALALRFIAGAATGFVLGSLAVMAGRKLWLLPLAFLLYAIAVGSGLSFGVNLSDVLFLNPFSPLHPLAGQWLLFDV